MWHLCCSIWQKKEWLLDWCRAVIVPLAKKGNLKECTNHRTISLICHASKVLLKIIIQRMRMKSQQEISYEQVGFREGRGTRDQIVHIRNVIKKCREHTYPLYLCFIYRLQQSIWLCQPSSTLDYHEEDGFPMSPCWIDSQPVPEPTICSKN